MKRALLLTLVLGAGCPRSPPDSPQYREAQTLYTQLYARSLDDAYGDPEMAHVAQLLSEVDPSSMQAQEAKDLAAKVDQGMADYKRRKEKVAADEQAAAQPARFEGGDPSEAPAPKPAAAAPALGPSLGMTRDEFTARFGDCFERKGDYEQGDKRGEAFALLPACTQRYPALENAVVVLLENRVAALVPLKEVSVRTLDAGSPAPAPPTPSPSSPPPPQQVRFLPGAPHPDVPAQPAPASP